MAMRGMTVLDVACRRGKGVYEIAEDVGPSGHAIGIDWDPSCIDAARNGIAHALTKMPWHDSAQASDPTIDFLVGYPENLIGAGIAPESIDLVFVNTAINSFFDSDEAYAQITHVLRPGGRLYQEIVCVDDADGHASEPMASGATSGVDAHRIPPSLANALTKDDALHRTEAAGLIDARVVSQTQLGIGSETSDRSYIDLVAEAKKRR